MRRGCLHAKSVGGRAYRFIRSSLYFPCYTLNTITSALSILVLLYFSYKNNLQSLIFFSSEKNNTLYSILGLIIYFTTVLLSPLQLPRSPVLKIMTPLVVRILRETVDKAEGKLRFYTDYRLMGKLDSFRGDRRSPLRVGSREI